MTTAARQFSAGDQVRSGRFGLGRVVVDAGATVVVRFEHGLEECAKGELAALHTPFQALDLPEWHTALRVITRAQAHAIQSVNDTWGVFSRSRIALLPHQLWVCRRVIERWPTRWLVADDVGLGKTIEAGLILWPLLSRGTVRRLLVLCPASLAEQWQIRLRTMFDIRLSRYFPEADTPRSDFWNTHTQVVASLQTLRIDHKGRWERLLAADPWDLLIVDEAHHLNADEESGLTLGYSLVQQLADARKVESMVFFTGTPHRGKNFGFLSLLHLLHPELFDPRRPYRAQLPNLSQVMIRNNKQDVTDLRGRRLFQPPEVRSETYRYSPAEARFYWMLTEFIESGEAYASSLDATTGRAVMLVLIALQKLASSSVAAIRRALRRRLEHIADSRRRLAALEGRRSDVARSLAVQYEEAEAEGGGDELGQLEERIAELAGELRLMEGEEPRLRELVEAADAVKEETKIQRLLSLVETDFAGRSVLFFTEYKATQSLLMSALLQRFGNGCVTFINGDNRAEEVYDPWGVATTFTEGRERAAEWFNTGQVRFLVSTEAGGEGIDLHRRCHSLIHVDLPWNPMRLHQRVGRLNRYGQTERVEVISLRNPDTVESLVWETLNAKISNIMLALSQVMDEPEDLLQLVLGMTSPSVFREVFAGARRVSRGSFASWFDERTARFGGREALDAVRDLVGHSARFDYQQVADELPRLDLPHLRPFLLAMLALNGRRPREGEAGLSFVTPDAWRTDPAVRTAYDAMTFEREGPGGEPSERILGVGHKLFDQALRQAKDDEASVATVPSRALPSPLFVFRIADRLTSQGGAVRAVVVGVEVSPDREPPARLLRDWELLVRLNSLCEAPGVRRAHASARPADGPAVRESLRRAEVLLDASLGELRLPFKVPAAEVVAVLWPLPKEAGDASEAEDEHQENE